MAHTYGCSFVFYGDDDTDALESRIIAALETEGLDFDPMTVTVERTQTDVGDDQTLYVVRSNEERDDGDAPLYWSNDQGWVALAAATTFTKSESETLNLPLGDCEWAELPAA